MKKTPLRAAAFLLITALALSACDGLGADPGARGIPAVLAADPDFSQLHDLVEASALAGTLAAGGPYTLFAPDDVAFLYLGGDTRTLLLHPDNADLLDRVLRHHVVPGRVEADDLTDGRVLETLAGGAHDGGVFYLLDRLVPDALDLPRRASVGQGVGFMTRRPGVQVSPRYRAPPAGRC